MFNSGTVVGPIVAAFIYAWLGPGWCFTINGISFVAVIIALLLMKIKPASAPLRRASALADLKEGVRYVAGNNSVRILILNMGVSSVFGLSLVTLLPAWSVEILGGDVTTNGILLCARGVGAFIGALMVAIVSRLNIKGKLWSAGSFVMPLTILAFAPVRWLPLSALVLVGLGWSFMIQANTSNALVQIQVPDILRGRVMGIFTLTFFGCMPVGALLAGLLASRIGEPTTVLLSGLILLGFAGLIHLRFPEIRQIK
jgi:predicted MFS family arabinose efflux permease